jgi:hypothetical protein
VKRFSFGKIVSADLDSLRNEWIKVRCLSEIGPASDLGLRLPWPLKIIRAPGFPQRVCDERHSTRAYRHDILPRMVTSSPTNSRSLENNPVQATKVLYASADPTPTPRAAAQTAPVEPIPPGWMELQERAQRAKSSAELVPIIDEMNKLLDEYEAEHGNYGEESYATPRATRKRQG